MKKLTLILALAVSIGLFMPSKAPAPFLAPLEVIEVQSPKEYARALVMEKWDNSAEFACLGKMWGKESAWNHQAKSPTHDYGIPQRHMKNATEKQISQFLSDPIAQIDWGVGYIVHRYNSPCEAWVFWRANNWY